MRKALLAPLVLAILLGVITALPTSASAASKKLNVPTPSQSSTEWCWAAATAGIIRYTTGKKISQCNLVRKLNRSKDCPNQSGNFRDVSSLMTKHGIESYFYNGALSLGYLQYQINNRKPMMGILEWPGKELGHIVVIDGYSGQYLYIDYIRPDKTYQIKVKYSEFLHNSRSKKYSATNGGSVTFPAHKWDRTYYAFRKA